MQYESLPVPEFDTSADLSRHYAKIRKGFHNEAAILKEQANKDAAEIRALHRLVGNQLEEHKRLIRDIAAFQAEIEKKRKILKDLKINLAEIDQSMPVDKITFATERVINAVAKVHNITTGEIRGPRRARCCTLARFHAICVISHNRPDLSVVQIGRIFGNRNHSTILHAQAQWPKLLKQLPSHIVAVEAELGILAVGS